MYWFNKLLTLTTEYDNRDKKVMHIALPQNIRTYIKEICKKGLPIKLSKSH